MHHVAHVHVGGINEPMSGSVMKTPTSLPNWLPHTSKIHGKHGLSLIEDFILFYLIYCVS